MSSIPSDRDAEDHRKHLEFIQAAISRMSSGSGRAKGWSITVTLAILGLAITARSWPAALLGFASVLFFGFLDTMYLREERKFRALYEDCRLGRLAVFDLNAADYGKPNTDRYLERCGWVSVVRSWAVWPLYAALAVVALGMFVGALTY